MNQTDELIDYLYSLKNITFSEKVVNQVKRCLLDYLGVTFAGAKMLREKEVKILEFNLSSGNTITAIGLNQMTDLFTATLINGFSSHVAELDDGVRYGAIHPGSPIFSALLPLAEKEGVCGTDFIAATVIAYEAAILLSSSIQPSHYNLGFHPTATCGSIGAAIGSAVLLNLTKKQFKDAFSAAAISASGSLKVIEDGSELKPFNAGRAALVGLISAITARSGFSGPDDVLSGDTGFFSMMAKDFKLTIPTKNQEYLIEKIYVKPYAACRHAHPSIEAVLRMQNEYDFNLHDIKALTINTYKGVIGKHDTKKISSVYSAKMSIPFGVAVSLKERKADIDQFSEKNINDSMIKSLIEKISIVPDEELSSLVPHKRAAIVKIETYDGCFFTERVDFPKGEPENPMTDDELIEKFLSLTKYADVKTTVCSKIMNKVWDLENNLSSLFPYLK
jgi:2-methylcitrate dehydratase PrpD